MTERSGGGYEPRDVSRAFVATLALLGFAVLGAGFAGTAALRAVLERRSAARAVPPSPLFETSGAPPAPRLDVEPERALRDRRARERSVLESYAWADARKGIVRIPIERAMDLVAQRGLPDWSAPASKGAGK